MTKQWTKWRVWRLRKDSWRGLDDNMIEEAPVSLIMAGEKAGVLMATPGLERELGAGFAMTMGWAKPDDPPAHAAWDAGTREVRLDVKGGHAFDPAVKALGGGPMGPSDAEPLQAEYAMELDTVLGFTSVLFKGQHLFDKTSASHAVALFDQTGRVRYVAEDAGRHNALDKAVGLAWLGGDLPGMRAAAFSGRMSLEMVLKAARAGIALMVSVSAPSGPAVRAALKLNVTLAGFARNRDLNVYTHPRRIRSQGKEMALGSNPGPVQDKQGE
jgi:FdhD protein